MISTSYTPLATGGAGVNPLSSYTYQDIGVNIDMTPIRVTLDGDIILDLTLDNSSLGPNVSVAGVSVPSFGQRKVQTRLRLRDGESNLLAGLLREDERKSLTGFPGAIHVPILKQLFSANDTSISQTDIVMLLTPHIIRTSGLTEQDLRPIYIGSAQNLGLGGPPPLIAGVPEPEAPSPGAAPAPAPAPGRAAGRHARSGRHNGRAAARLDAGARDRCGSAAAARRAAAATRGTAAAHIRRGATAAAPTPAAPAPVEPPITTPGVGLAQVILSPPATTFRVGAGPYTVPISIVNVLATLDGLADADLRSGAAARAKRSGRQLHAIGGGERGLHPADRARTRRHHHHARGRCDGRFGHRPSCGGALRRRRAGQRDADAERRRQRSGRPSRWVCSSGR